MTKRPRSPPGEPMGLANMRSLGIRSLAVTCELCHHAAVVDVARWLGRALYRRLARGRCAPAAALSAPTCDPTGANSPSGRA